MREGGRARDGIASMDKPHRKLDDLSQQLGFITEKARAEVDGPLTRVDKMLYALYKSKNVRA